MLCGHGICHIFASKTIGWQKHWKAQGRWNSLLCWGQSQQTLRDCPIQKLVAGGMAAFLFCSSGMLKPRRVIFRVGPPDLKLRGNCRGSYICKEKKWNARNK